MVVVFLCSSYNFKPHRRQMSALDRYMDKETRQNIIRQVSLKCDGKLQAQGAYSGRIDTAVRFKSLFVQ